MSELLERVIRRQQWIRESRDIAVIFAIVMLPIAFVALLGIRRSIQVAGSAFTAGGIVCGLGCVVSVWIAFHFFRESLRLGKLLRDPELITRLNEEAGLDGGVRWSGLIPFSGRRNEDCDES
jgi:multidrug transporter EmrE-like cation transporter